MARAGGGAGRPEAGGGEEGTPARDCAHRFWCIAGRTPGAIFVGTVAGVHLWGVCAQVQRVRGEVRLVGLFTELATVRQILEHVGEPTSAPAIAPARSPPLEMDFAQRLAAPEAEFEAIPELEFDQAANLRAEAGHDRLGHNAGVDAEPIPELEFDQTLGW